MKKNEDIDVNDLNPSDFEDPIRLLEALKKYSHQDVIEFTSDNSASDENDTEGSLLFTLKDIQEQYHVNPNEVIEAVYAGKLRIARIVPLFEENDICQYISENLDTSSVLFEAFLREVHDMRLNYSYKPILLLAILATANENGQAQMDHIISYYLDYYAHKVELGEIPEKRNSSFVKHPNDREQARKTIIKYPLSIFVNRGFLEFDKDKDIVTFKDSIWRKISQQYKQEIISCCKEALRNYYMLN